VFKEKTIRFKYQTLAYILTNNQSYADPIKKLSATSRLLFW